MQLDRFYVALGIGAMIAAVFGPPVLQDYGWVAVILLSTVLVAKTWN